MSGRLLITLDALGEPSGWRTLGGEGAPAQGGFDGGSGWPDGPWDDIVAIVPGEAVTVHWLELPGDLAPAQALAAARLMAAEVSAQPLADMHVAVGRASEGGTLRAVALAPALAMAAWIARAQALGVDPDVIVPATLLLPVPAEGLVRLDGPVALFRGGTEAFAMEPGLARLVAGDAPVVDVDAAAVEAALPALLDDPEVNLRQGAFAKRRRAAIDRKALRRAAGLALAVLIVTLALQLALIWRYTAAADAAEAELRQVAGAVLGDAAPADPAPLLAQRLAEAGAGAGYRGLASAVFEAVRATPGVELAGLDYDREGSLRVAAAADAPATVAALIGRIEGAGMAVRPGVVRQAGGKTVQDLTVEAR